MNDEILFGDIHRHSPSCTRRPGQDSHSVVVPFEATDPEDLPIYVDLDTLRELESHAASDTSVELGGVLLGHQRIDPSGQAFVIVEGSIRARHYRATKGSFTFTHDSWRAITLEKERRLPELRIVGWYHTHPGWGVFLSGMDDFICQNFFDQPLDVALVIDPCQNDRGWFQWGASGATRKCKSFFVMSSKDRKEELHEYLGSLSERKFMSHEKKYLSEVQTFPPGTTLQISNYSRPQEWLLLGTFLIQTAVLLIVAWRLLALEGGAVVRRDGAETVAEAWRAEIRNDVLTQLISKSFDDPEAVVKAADQISALKVSQLQNESALISHIARIQALETSITQANQEVSNAKREIDRLQFELRNARQPTNLEANVPWYQRYGGWFLAGGALTAIASATGVLWMAFRFPASSWKTDDEERSSHKVRGNS